MGRAAGKKIAPTAHAGQDELPRILAEQQLRTEPVRRVRDQHGGAGANEVESTEDPWELVPPQESQDENDPLLWSLDLPVGGAEDRDDDASLQPGFRSNIDTLVNVGNICRNRMEHAYAATFKPKLKASDARIQKLWLEASLKNRLVREIAEWAGEGESDEAVEVVLDEAGERDYSAEFKIANARRLHMLLDLVAAQGVGQDPDGSYNTLQHLSEVVAAADRRAWVRVSARVVAFALGRLPAVAARQIAEAAPAAPGMTRPQLLPASPVRADHGGGETDTKETANKPTAAGQAASGSDHEPHDEVDPVPPEEEGFEINANALRPLTIVTSSGIAGSSVSESATWLEKMHKAVDEQRQGRDTQAGVPVPPTNANQTVVGGSFAGTAAITGASEMQRPVQEQAEGEQAGVELEAGAEDVEEGPDSFQLCSAEDAKPTLLSAWQVAPLSKKSSAEAGVAESPALQPQKLRIDEPETPDAGAGVYSATFSPSQDVRRRVDLMGAGLHNPPGSPLRRPDVFEEAARHKFPPSCRFRTNSPTNVESRRQEKSPVYRQRRELATQEFYRRLLEGRKKHLLDEHCYRIAGNSVAPKHRTESAGAEIAELLEKDDSVTVAGDKIKKRSAAHDALNYPSRANNADSVIEETAERKMKETFAGVRDSKTEAGTPEEVPAAREDRHHRVPAASQSHSVLPARGSSRIAAEGKGPRASAAEAKAYPPRQGADDDGEDKESGRMSEPGERAERPSFTPHLGSAFVSDELVRQSYALQERIASVTKKSQEVRGNAQDLQQRHQSGHGVLSRQPSPASMRGSASAVQLLLSPAPGLRRGRPSAGGLAGDDKARVHLEAGLLCNGSVQNLRRNHAQLSHWIETKRNAREERGAGAQRGERLSEVTKQRKILTRASDEAKVNKNKCDDIALFYTEMNCADRSGSEKFGVVKENQLVASSCCTKAAQAPSAAASKKEVIRADRKQFMTAGPKPAEKK
eukprot:g4676.t1